jgi:glycosyltransferase A (GT-A) superfamily protein (DUF2064 family)
MAGAGAAVLLMPPGRVDGELEQLLGDDRARELRAVLSDAAEEWALQVAGGSVHHAGGGESLSDAAARAFAAHDGPLLVLWPVLLQPRREHVVGALDDLRAGSDVVLGPVIDGGLYLLGLARPLPAVLALPAERWQDPDVITIALGAVADAGLEVGMLRAERALRRPADVRAALADPLLGEAVGRILDPARARRWS